MNDMFYIEDDKFSWDGLDLMATPTSAPATTPETIPTKTPSAISKITPTATQKATPTAKPKASNEITILPYAGQSETIITIIFATIIISAIAYVQYKKLKDI